MIKVNELKNRNPVVWTSLMAQGIETRDIVVTAVSQEKLFGSRSLTRYILALAGYSEPITLIAKKTNVAEAIFYRRLTSDLAFLVPHCWFSDVEGDDGWVILDEVYNDWPPHSWKAADIEGVVKAIVTLHGANWETKELLDIPGWSPYLGETFEAPDDVSGSAADQNEDAGGLQLSGLFSRIRAIDGTLKPVPSEHAVQTAGQLTSKFNMAAITLDKLVSCGFWPAVVKEDQLQAILDLLDDPLPMLYPLRQLPYTLLHGDLAIDNWHLDLFDQYRLLDWQNVTLGPGILDLISFVEQFDMFLSNNGWRQNRSMQELSEETLIDSYILAMGANLGKRFRAIEHRRAIPAARCLYLLTTWLPRIEEWLDGQDHSNETWIQFNELGHEKLIAQGHGDVVTLRHHIGRLFKRFMLAYRSL